MSTTKRHRKRAEKAYIDAQLDQALEATFPASDPVAIAVEAVPLGPEEPRDLDAQFAQPDSARR